jgi:putative redox protein
MTDAAIDAGLTTTASAHAFADTAARLEAALDGRGLTVFARIDHAAGARAAGLELRPTLLLIFGDARGGTALMRALPTAGLDLPLKMLVWEDDAGAVHLTYRDPASIADARGADPASLPVVSNLAKALASLTAAVVGDEPLAPPLVGDAVAHDKGPGHIQAQVSTGGQSFFTDEPMAAGGGGAGPSPHDLLAAALAACTTMTLRLYADRKAWPLERIHVAVDHLREPDAAPPDLFRRRVALGGPLDGEQRERLMQIADRCPVHRTLTAGARIEAAA